MKNLGINFEQFLDDVKDMLDEDLRYFLGLFRDSKSQMFRFIVGL